MGSTMGRNEMQERHFNVTLFGIQTIHQTLQMMLVDLAAVDQMRLIG
jgi:hypothetical protein